MKVLIAEDDAVTRHMLEVMLTGWGYEVLVSCDGDEAWQALQSKDAPKLAILDWMMPGMDGPTICRKIRESPGHQTTYAILCTVKGQKGDIVAGLRAGADDYVSKPFDPEELQARIQVGCRTVELHRMKNELISFVGHELKNPLTSIISALSIITSDQTVELPGHIKRMADIAYRSSERMCSLLNDILDIRRIESGAMDLYLQPVGLNPLVEQAVEANRVYAGQLQVMLDLEDDTTDIRANVDVDRFIQVVTNLLSNAIRFSPPGEKVVVSISRFDDKVRVSVIDRGPGIPAEFRERIFEKFTQFHHPGARRKGGAGLGLSIAKAIVEAMKGSIGFETEVGSGTTFYFDLPEYQVDTESTNRQTSLPEVSSDKT